MFWEVTVADVASSVLAIVAIAVSIIALSQSDKIGKASIRSDNCSKIFDSYLIKQIPEARTRLHFGSDGRLQNGNGLCNELDKMMISSLFYKYDDNKFFVELNRKCDSLVDDIVDAGNHSLVSEYEQNHFFENVQKNLEDIYDLIDKKRTGKR